ncbi:putative two-component system sensor kinase [Nocardia nova SH22a]|uniref:histidine kinase n=1 Tax=Nocardia nova SH22a TaxID=1415166 RepID=W5THA0_9NOCA|nr:putative two-component system sensor kinase [Nocardia nova SH22a]
MGAAAVDAIIFALSGILSVDPVAGGAVLAAMIAADLAFAAPPSTAAVVAVVQVVLRVVASLLLHRHGLTVRVADAGFLVAGYRAGAWMSGRASVIIVPVLVLGASAAPLISRGTASGDWRLLLTSAVSGGLMPWLVGRYTAGRGAYIAELEQRERLARQQQRAALDRALTDERAAIARDLHDVITHHVSAIGIHAGAARMALGATTSGAAPAARSLAAVESESRAAMVDLRRQLDFLHGREDGDPRQPGMADIDELVDRMRAAGLEVSAVTADRALPRSLDITVFRIVQELLTNALRHGTGTATLTVAADTGNVVIRESNPVAAQSVPESAVTAGLAAMRSGSVPRGPLEALPESECEEVRATAVARGLEGIRRRAELFGGSVTGGLLAEDRWEITVRIPGPAS